MTSGSVNRDSLQKALDDRIADSLALSKGFLMCVNGVLSVEPQKSWGADRDQPRLSEEFIYKHPQSAKSELRR